jgi:DNA polymerase-1
VAQSVFGADPGSADFKRARSAAKVINFGVPYGAGWRLLSENPQLRLTETEARSFFTAYHASNPEIQSTREALFKRMLHDPQTRFVNWAGRARHAPKLRHPAEDLRSSAERAAFASLVQGSAAELTRFTLVRLWQAQESGELPAVTTSTVHDEVQVDCAVDAVPFVAEFVQRTMEDFSGMFGTIPIIAEVEWSRSNWANKEPYHVR